MSQNSQENTCARVAFLTHVNFAKFLRTLIFIEHLWWLLLYLAVRKKSFSEKFMNFKSSHQRCSIKKLFLNISKGSQENT